MLSSQLKLSLSYYSDLYDMIVPKDHILRKIRELVDFSFIYDELKNKYCLDNGRNAKNPILLFKYLLLKYLYNLSDNGVVERSRYDMSFKYFLELTPEEEVIHPSLLTKFRKQRLKDENILDLLINKSVELAINQGVLKVPDPAKPGNYKKLTKLTEFLEFKGMDSDKINPVNQNRAILIY